MMKPEKKIILITRSFHRREMRIFTPGANRLIIIRIRGNMFISQSAELLPCLTVSSWNLTSDS